MSSFETKSLSPTHNPVSHSIDPVLARYHAIKKQMEENGGSIYGTPPPGSNNPNRNGTTPRRTVLANTANNTNNNNNSNRYGTPAPGSSQPAPLPSLSLYNAGLTPNNQDMNNNNYAARNSNLQRVFTSPTSFNSNNNNNNFPKSNTTMNNMENNASHIAQLELEAERRRTRELDENRRQLAVERDRQREKTTELESRLKTESAASMEASNHVYALKSESDRANRLIESLQLDLVSRSNEITALRERQMHLERKLLDAEAELAGGGGGTSHRTLSGKVHALEDLLKQKHADIEEEQRRTKIGELKLQEEREKGEALMKEIQNKDRENGELVVALRDGKRLKERADQRVNDSEAIERELEGKISTLEEKLRAAAESAEVEISQHKEELRAKGREYQRLEVTVAGYQSEVKELTATKVQLDREIELLKESVTNANREAKTWQARQEALSVLNMSETSAKEEARREVSRIKQEQLILHDELRAHVKQCEQYERLLAESDKDRDVKDALEAQVRVLQASFSRQEEDVKSLQHQVESEQRRCSALEEQASKVGPLEKKAAEFEALAELRLDQLTKTRQRESLLETELDATAGNLQNARQEAEDARREFVMAHERCVSLQHEIVGLEEQLSLLVEAQEKLALLNDAIESRNAQIISLQIEVTSWQSRFREADAEATNLRAVQLRLQATEDKLVAVQELIHQRDEVIKAHERRANAQQGVIREFEEDRKVFASEKTVLETEIARLTGAISDKASLESRLRSAIGELQSRQDELTRERNRVIDIQSRLHERDDAAAQERQKRTEFESHAHNLQGELSKVQIDLGRVQVLLDGSEKERHRLEHILENRTREFTAKQDVVANLERSLQERDEEIRVRAITDNNVRHEIELSELKMRDLRAQLDAARKSVDEQKEVVRKFEVERRHQQARSEDVHRLEDKLSGSESVLVAREDEIASLHQQNLQLKQRVKELQSDISSLRQNEQRVVELKSLIERQSVHLDQAEKEDSSKSAKILEKERELGRVREKLASVTGELESEKLRRSSAEATSHELEAASSKAIQLEGQVAGLNQVLSQRSKDLEEARALVSELRERLRNVGASGGGGGTSNSRGGTTTINLATAELDAKLRAKDETIARLEAEEQRRSSFVETLRKDVAAKEADNATLQRQVQDLQSQLDRSEISWRARCTRLEHELGEMAKRNPANDSRFRRLEDEFLDAKVRNTTLQTEIDRLKKELVNHVGNGNGFEMMDSSSAFSISRRQNATNRLLQNEMNRTRNSLEGINHVNNNNNNNNNNQHDSSSTSSTPLPAVTGSFISGPSAFSNSHNNNNNNNNNGIQSPEPKRRTVRDVTSSAAANSRSTPTFLNYEADGGRTSPSAKF